MIEGRGWLRVFVAMGCAAIKTAGLLFVLRFASSKLPFLELGSFLLARRLAGTAANITQFGVSNAVLRFCAPGPQTKEWAEVFFAGVFIWFVNVGLLCSVAVCFSRQLGDYVFPDSQAGTMLVWACCVLVSGTIGGYLAYTMILAEQRVLEANVVEVLNAVGFLALGLVTVGGLKGGSVALLIQGILMNIGALAVVGWCLVRNRSKLILRSSLCGRGLAKVFSYGWPRSLAGVAEMTVFTSAAWMCRKDGREMASLLAAMTVARLVQAVCTPLSQLVVVVTAGLSQAGAHRKVEKGLRWVVRACGIISIPIFGFFVPFAGIVSGFVFGDIADAAEVGTMLIPILIALPAYLLYSGLKGVIDVIEERPYSLMLAAGAVVVSVLTFQALNAAWGLGHAASIGVSAGVHSMAIGAFCIVRKAVGPGDLMIMVGGCLLGGAIGCLAFALG